MYVYCYYTYIQERTDCNPLRRSNGSTIFPCGLIANSFFNGECMLPGYEYEIVI